MTTPVKLFQGYSSTARSCLSTAVTGERKTEGVQSEVTYTLCRGQKSVMTTIQVKQSLDGKIKILGSGQEKLDFLMKLNTTETTMSIVVHARKVEGKEVQTSAELASDDTVVPVSDTADFFFHYGDAYVSSITTGGEYIGVLTFHTETESDRIKLELELRANGIFKFATVQFDLQLKVDRVVESSQTKVSFNQMVLGLEENFELPKFEEMVEFARKFPSMKLTAPKILAFETTGYEHVVGIPNSFNPVASNRNKLVGMGFRDLGLVGKFNKVCHLIDQIEEIQSIYDFYGGYNDDSKLNDVAIQAKQDLATLQKTFFGFHTNPTVDVVVPTLPSLFNGTPYIQYKIRYSEEYGSCNGEYSSTEQKSTTFDLFTGYDEYIRNKTRITGIRMRCTASQDRVTSIVVDFESSSSSAAGRRTEVYGRDESGRLSKKLVFGDYHFIKKICVRCGVEVDRLGIYLDDDRSVMVGGSGGSEHRLDISSPGSFVMGFRGSYSNTLVEQIQVVYAEFQPAKWSL
uniref:Jacalin-type lectin domain-containing protein n=1 Tax=Cannabis sativa TaxID=3483 RepID=A0A803QDT6_CANSA